MSKRRLICASFTLSGLLVGCGPSGPKPSTPVPVSPTGAGSTTKPVAALYPPVQADARDTVPSGPRQTADIVSQRADEYSRRVEQVLAKRSANGAQVASSATPGPNPTGNSSDVRFLDPRAAQRAPNGDDAATPATALPTVEVRNQGNTQVASISPVIPVAPPTVTQTPSRMDVPFNKDTPAVNTTLTAGQPRPLAATDDLARRFFQQVHDYPQDISSQLDWQLLQFLEGQSVPQLQSLSTLPAEDRELLSALLDGLTNFRNGVKVDNNMLLSRKIRPLIELGERLKTQAELTIPTLALCTDVKGFGVYEPIQPARFNADSDHRVIVYCEVENFSSTLDEQKRWETKLTQEVVLYTEQGGEEVWRDKIAERPIVDYSRNRRHDFFIVKMIRLPKSLSLGRYLLKVTVVDKQMNRVAESAVPVQIVAQ